MDVDAVAHARSTVERNNITGHIRLQEAVMGKYVGVGRHADDAIDRSLSVDGGSVQHGDDEEEEKDDKECLRGDRSAVVGDGPVLQALRPLLLDQEIDRSMDDEVLQAVMCNPPFYDLVEEVGTYSSYRVGFIATEIMSHIPPPIYHFSLSPSDPC